MIAFLLPPNVSGTMTTKDIRSRASALQKQQLTAEIVVGSPQDLCTTAPSNEKPLTAVWHFFQDMRRSDSFLNLGRKRVWWMCVGYDCQYNSDFPFALVQRTHARKLDFTRATNERKELKQKRMHLEQAIKRPRN